MLKIVRSSSAFSITFFRRLSLRSKMLFCALLTVMPLVILLLYDYGQESERNKNVAMGDQRQTAQTVAALTDTVYGETLALAWNYSFNPTVKTMKPSVVDSYLAGMLSLNQFHEDLTVFDKNGDIRGSTLTSPTGSVIINIADGAYFERVMATNDAAISNILMSTHTGKPAVILAVPMRDDAGKANGVFAITLSLDYLPTLLENVRLAPGQAIFLTDLTGRAAFHTEVPELTWEDRDLSNWQPLKSALQNGTILVDSVQSPLLPDRRLGALVSTPRYGWIVGVTTPVDTALAPAQGTLRSWLIAIVVVATISIVLAFLMANLLSGPISRLREQAKSFGQGDLSKRIKVENGDELEQMAASLNEMADRLQRTLGDLQTILDSTENGVVMFGLDGRARFANKRLGELMGVPYSHFVDCEWTDCVRLVRDRLEKPEKFEKSMSEAFARPEDRIIDEVVLVQPSRTVLRRFSGPAVEDGHVIGRIEIFTDVTEEKKEERRREAIAQTARALVEELEIENVAKKVVEQTVAVFGAHTAGLWLADNERRELKLLTLWNFPPDVAGVFERPSFDSSLTTSRAAATGKSQVVEDISDLGPEFSMGKQVMERMGQRSVVAYPLKARGRLVGVMTYAKKEPHPLGPGDLKTLGIMCNIFAAAIENARLYQQVKQALHLRDEFLSSAAHELRTPVTSLKGFSQLLLKEGGRHTEIERKALEAIDRQCNRISHLTQDLFTVSELQIGGIKFEKNLFDLRKVAEETAREMQMVLGGEQYRINVTVSPEPVIVRSDRDRLSEVFRNLVDSAIGRSPIGGMIELQVYSRDEEAVGLVRDHGAQIPKERFQHIFEPFYESIPAGVAGYRGVVLLGPYICRQIIEKLGGWMWFESEEDGSTFYFTLPLAGKEEETPGQGA